MWEGTRRWGLLGVVLEASYHMPLFKKLLEELFHQNEEAIQTQSGGGDRELMLESKKEASG